MKSLKKNPKKAATVYLRYEFSNEAGKLEGGDIFEFASLSEVQEMTSQIFKVAQSDGVAVNVTIGTEKPFFGFLKNVGLARKDIQMEMVPAELAPVSKNKKSRAKKAKAKK